LVCFFFLLLLQISFGREETFRLLLSIKRLVETRPLKSVRLFGKILGTKASYYVLESEVREGEELPESDLVPGQAITPSSAPSDLAATAEGENAEEGKTEEGKGEKAEKALSMLPDGVPRPKVKKYAPLPAEVGTGANKYTYWVCSERAYLFQVLCCCCFFFFQFAGDADGFGLFSFVFFFFF
jgi:radial spoke head protein 4A